MKVHLRLLWKFYGKNAVFLLRVFARRRDVEGWLHWTISLSHTSDVRHVQRNQSGLWAAGQTINWLIDWLYTLLIGLLFDRLIDWLTYNWIVAIRLIAWLIDCSEVHLVIFRFLETFREILPRLGQRALPTRRIFWSANFCAYISRRIARKWLFPWADRWICPFHPAVPSKAHVQIFLWVFLCSLLMWCKSCPSWRPRIWPWASVSFCSRAVRRFWSVGRFSSRDSSINSTRWRIRWCECRCDGKVSLSVLFGPFFQVSAFLCSSRMESRQLDDEIVALTGQNTGQGLMSCLRGEFLPHFMPMTFPCLCRTSNASFVLRRVVRRQSRLPYSWPTQRRPTPFVKPSTHISLLTRRNNPSHSSFS